MRRLFALAGFAVLLSSCGRDPNVLKLKYLDAGNRYFEKGRYREASIMYRNAIKQDPRFGMAHYKRAYLHVQMNQFAEAIQSFRRAIELLPSGEQRTDSRIKLADLEILFLEKVRFENELMLEVDRLANELLEGNHSYHGRRIKGIMATIQARDLADKALLADANAHVKMAIADLSAANDLNPLQPEVVIPLARSFWADNRPAEAEKLLLAFIERNKTFEVSYMELHRIYMSQRRPADAEKILKRAIENSPKHHGFLNALAKHYLDSGDRAQSLRVVQEIKSSSKDYPEAFISAGAFYMAMARYEDAVRTYEEAIQATGDKRKYRRMIVEARLAEGRRKEAIELNEAILKDDPKDVDSLVRRAGFHYEDGKIKESLADLQGLLQLAPSHFAVHYNLGRALLADGQREQARFRFAEAVRLRPTFLAARNALAQIEFDTGEYLKAVQSADESLRFERTNWGARVLRAKGLRGLRKFEDAHKEVSILLAASPKSDVVMHELGALYHAEGKVKEAEAAYRKSYETNPSNLQGLISAIEIFIDAKDSAGALKTLEAEVKRRPQSFGVRRLYADTLARADKRAQAQTEYLKLLADASKNNLVAADVHDRLGNLYRKSNDGKTAIAHLEKARELNPKSPVILHNLAVAYDTFGRPGEARRLYEATLKEEGDNPIALNNLAYHIAESGGDLDQALTFAQRARQKMPNSPEILDTMARIYLKKNLVDNAMEILMDLVRKNPRQPTFRYHLAEVLLKKGDKEWARRELKT
ncbi:MAG: tetratricopeptide repeat protein, partial [Bryobacteraceae bacterium]